MSEGMHCDGPSCLVFKPVPPYFGLLTSPGSWYTLHHKGDKYHFHSAECVVDWLAAHEESALKGRWSLRKKKQG